MQLFGIELKTLIELFIVSSSIIGGIWGFYTIKKMRSFEPMLNIELLIESLKGKESNIIDISIITKNIGKVAIWADLPNPDCILEIKKIPDGMDDTNLIWTDSKLEPLLPPIQYLGEPGLEEKEYFVFEPSEINIFHVLITTKYDGILAFKANFVNSRTKELWTWTAYKIINLCQ